MGVNILMFQDLHASDKSPPFRKDNYLEAVREKLEQLNLIAKKLSARAILNAGDTFHKKKPVDNSHFLVQSMIQWFKGMPCPVLGVTGNHDITRDDLNAVDKQPIGTLYKSGAMVSLSARGEVVVYADEEMEVRVVGIDFHRNINDVYIALDNLKSIPLYVEGTSRRIWVICVLHAFASAGGRSKVFDEDSIGYDELDMFRPDAYAMGHDHRNLGCGYTTGKKVLLRPGALTRGSISYEDVNRKPSVGWLECSPTGLVAKSILLRYADAAEVFDFSLKEEKDAEEASENLFIDALKKVSPEDGVDVFSWLQAKVTDGAVRERVLELLDEQGVTRGKDGN